MTIQQNLLRVQPFVFNWPGQLEHVLEVEEQFSDMTVPGVELAELTVVNSDIHNERHHWCNIGDKYFGPQFAKALELHREGHTLLHIQGDATYERWADVIARLPVGAQEYDWGIMAPNLSRTIWDDEKGPSLSNGGFKKVLHTDCTAWSIHPQVVDAAKDFAKCFEQNEYGWGVDTVVIALARLQGKIVLRDYSHTITHHGETNYRMRDAGVMSEKMFEKIPERIRNEALTVSDELKKRFSKDKKKEITARVTANEKKRSQTPSQPTVSVVSAVMNRPEPLAYSLPTWLNAEQPAKVDEIILIDWGSKTPLVDSLAAMDIPGYPSDILRIIRVENASHWHITKALNLGFAEATSDWVIKLDADVLSLSLDPRRLLPTEGSFATGSWKTARNNNEQHLNGQLVVRRGDFWAINGYDERIVRYGWDDSDIYDRLSSKAGLKRELIDPGELFHLPHSQGKRMVNGLFTPETPENSIQTQRSLTQNRTAWSLENTRGTYEGFTQIQPGYKTIRIKSRPF